MLGSVKWFNTTKGYGFITPDNGGADVFVHVKDVQASGLSTLDPGQKVDFVISPTRGGKTSATNIRLV